MTSARGCAIVDAMNRARLPKLPLGGGLMVPGLVSGRQVLAPADKPAGGGRSYHCRGGSGRHVGSLLGARLNQADWLASATGCPSRRRRGLVRGFGGWGRVSPGVLRESAPSQHLAPRGERRRSVPASISPISAETASRSRLPVPALNNKETLL